MVLSVVWRSRFARITGDFTINGSSRPFTRVDLIDEVRFPLDHSD